MQEHGLRDNGQPAAKNNHLPDWTDKNEVRRAFIASEIFNRKY